MQGNGCMLLAMFRNSLKTYLTDWWCWAQISAHQTYPATLQSWVQFAAQAHVHWTVQATGVAQQVHNALPHISDVFVAHMLMFSY